VSDRPNSWSRLVGGLDAKRSVVLQVLWVQLCVGMLVAGAVWLVAGFEEARTAASGSGAVMAGTLAYRLGQGLVPSQAAPELLWGHVVGELMKIAVTLGLLFWGLVSMPADLRGAMLAGFVAVLLVQPLAMLLLKRQ
jgi:F0F1-type ATP synthase assembly protein I